MWHIQGEMPWCLLFANGIVLVNESRDGLAIDWRRGDKILNLKGSN